ncbi:MAG: DUF288 domain-containing protein [Acidobacteriaceae bacterium]|nr:DUF288 domain-containing protein [Acidobacteriaceae bacterium]
MPNQTSIVVTSIAAPNGVLKSIASGCRDRGMRFYVIGDVPSPSTFTLDGCDFYSLERQAKTGFRFAELCPKRHYARKNIGYLLAMREGSRIIIETDDDNYPLPEFWNERARQRRSAVVNSRGWLNVYAYFTDANIWPRGLPLDAVMSGVPEISTLPAQEVDAPIQQALADDNPDVDAIYRLVLPLPLKFRKDVEVALGPYVWCPFNSQNTTWWPEAYGLLYLPAHCSFRMTDIWRSFVAQRIAWENGWSVLFESPTVWQDRNDHNLMRDFSDELPGYLHNRAICEKLGNLSLRPGLDAIHDNLRLCYEMLVKNGFVGESELPLLEAWLYDLAQLRVDVSERAMVAAT